MIFVVFVVAPTTHTDLPYVLGATLHSSTVEVVRPSHLLIIAAFFMLILSETGRIPIGSHGGRLEFGQIDDGRVAEHSGPGPADAFEIVDEVTAERGLVTSEIVPAAATRVEDKLHGGLRLARRRGAS